MILRSEKRLGSPIADATVSSEFRVTLLYDYYRPPVRFPNALVRFPKDVLNRFAPAVLDVLACKRRRRD